MVDPKLIPLAVSRAWHSDPDVHVLLDQVLPNTADGDWGRSPFLTDAQEADGSLHGVESSDRAKARHRLEKNICVHRHAGRPGTLR